MTVRNIRQDEMQVLPGFMSSGCCDTILAQKPSESRVNYNFIRLLRNFADVDYGLMLKLR